MGEDVCCGSEADGLIILLLVIAAGIYYWRQKYWIVGKAVAVSGHTLRIGDSYIRLHGLTALQVGYLNKPAQPWADHNSVQHDGGDICRQALQQLVAGKKVKCRLRQFGGSYGRFYAQAFIDCEDIGAWMVAHGYAVADVRFHRKYVKAEKKAKREKNGIWRGTFENPVLWGKRRANELVLYPAYRRKFPGKSAPDDKIDVWKVLNFAWDVRGLIDPTTALLPGENNVLFDLLAEL